jgi:hypothetical protein
MIQIVERKLGRERAYGLAWPDELIEVDPRQKPRDYLGTVIHEALHQVFPEKSESEVARGASTLTRLLWGIGYRRVKRAVPRTNGSVLKVDRRPAAGLLAQSRTRRRVPRKSRKAATGKAQRG